MLGILGGRAVSLITHLRKRNTVLVGRDIYLVSLCYWNKKDRLFLNRMLQGDRNCLALGCSFPGSTVPVHPLQL